MQSQDNPNASKTPDSPKPAAGVLSPKNVLLAIAALFLILLIALAISKPANKPPTKVMSPSQSVVEVRDSGFSPGTITVSAGTQVTWVNKGQKSHQVSADPYPLDNSISGFNSSQVLLPGDSLTFAFESKGTYHLHDNLNPLDQSLRQTVIVK